VTDGCVFCRIVHGEAEASVAYEDAATIAFMDINQFCPGHTLIVTKRHVPDIFSLDDETGAAVMIAMRRVAQAVKDAFRPHGVNIWQSNGVPWQEVLHLHIHVLPRWREDGLLRLAPARLLRPPRSELDEQATRIGAALAALEREP
jgi:histidine triad (HIT) family protein